MQNGFNHDLSEEEQQVAREIQRLAARNSITVTEAVEPSPAFEQKAHTLLLESIDRIEQQWVTELQSVRNNTLVVEQMVKKTCTKAKDDITRLHLLGAQVRQEARRGEEVCNHLEDQIEQLMELRAP